MAESLLHLGVNKLWSKWSYLPQRRHRLAMLKKIQNHCLSKCKEFRKERQSVGYILWVFWWHFLLGRVFFFYSGLDFALRANEKVQSTEKERPTEFGIQACFLVLFFFYIVVQNWRPGEKFAYFFHKSKLCCKSLGKFKIKHDCHKWELGLSKLIEK